MAARTAVRCANQRGKSAAPPQGVADHRQVARRQRLLGFGVGVLSVVCFLTLWETLTRVGVIDRVILASPSMVVGELGKLISDGSLLHHVILSSQRVLAGFVLSSLVAIPLGVLLGTSRVLKAIMDPVISIIRPLPSLSWIPLSMLWLGIGETQKYYARAFFEHWNVDAVTLNPFLGFDTVEPFLAYEGKGVYLLAVTSNPGAADIEMKRCADGRYVFEHVQDMVARAAGLPGDVGLVVGLTNASEDVQARIADVPLLMPGLGAQGGDLRLLADSRRKAPVVVNVSRGILYGQGGAAALARDFRDRIAGAA